MHTSRLTPVLGLALAAAAFGQGVPQPQTWLTQLLPCTNPNDPQTCITSDPLFVSMESVQVHAPGQHPDPIVAARTIAQRIVNHIAWGQQTADTTAIFLHGWGHDGALSDCPCTSGSGCAPCCCSAVWNQNTRFFCEADRLVGLDDSEFPSTNDPEDRTYRAYRHPFLKNATRVGPLRAWTQSFMAEMEKIRTLSTNPLYLPALPNGDDHTITWTFDTESPIAAYQGVNSLFMLRKLAEDYPEIWDTWVVPGSPGWETPNQWPAWNTTNQAYDTMPSNAPGMTLAELYAAARAVYTNWPEDILDQDDGINVGLGPTNAQNRKFLIWWYSIARRAEDAVMTVSGYDEIKAVWTASVCSNYDNARTDGETDTYGWFIDQHNANAVENEYPRGINYRQPSSVLMAQDNGHDRWMNVYQYASGERDSPQLYPLSVLQTTGWPGGRGHGQASPYLPPGTLCCASTCDPEDLEYCRIMNTLRLDRQDVESIINSYGGLNWLRLQPWLIQPIIATSTNPFDYYENEAVLRWVLAMLRAKRAPELLLWTGSGDRVEQNAAWTAARSLIRRVWAPSVAGIKIVSGDTPSTAPDPAPDMLEDTLRDSGGQLSTLDILTTHAQVWDGTLLQVEFQIDMSAIESAWAIEINVECEVNREGVVGRVFVYNFNNGEWYQVPTEEGPSNDPVYEFYTPDNTTRRRFVVDDPMVDFEDGGTILVRLEHESDVIGSSTILRSRYDLVQIVPYYLELNPLGGPEGVSMPPSDVNLDGGVDTTDIVMFYDAWAESAPLADVNQDAQVDAQDVFEFEASLNSIAP